jgi:hypothetical protein
MTRRKKNRNKKSRSKTPRFISLCMEPPSWHLVDADPIAAEYPDTFEKPTRQEISRARPGDHVQLIFGCGNYSCDEGPAERMWVLVDERLPSGRYRGRLRNDPCMIEVLKFDDPVEFTPCHVIEIETSTRPAEVEPRASLV